MGKTFKYGYCTNSLQYLKKNKMNKTNCKRRNRMEIKNDTNVDYHVGEKCGKINRLIRHEYCIPFRDKHNSRNIEYWNKKLEDLSDKIKQNHVYVYAIEDYYEIKEFTHKLLFYDNRHNLKIYAYNYIDTFVIQQKIREKQLQRRNEIGRYKYNKRIMHNRKLKMLICDPNII